MLMGSRESGKSYSVSGMIAHSFLTDGATRYDEYTIKYPSPVEILVGAEDSKFSSDLLTKVKHGFDFLPGKQTLERTYPSPLSKRFSGSWEPNKEIKAEYKKKENGAWVYAGSKSSIKHRTFSSNPYAAQGTRPLLLVLEECFKPDTKVRMYDGSVKKVENLVLGDVLMSPSNRPTYVKRL
jgi:hypothetical protein